jgi:hypothetical protein
VNSPACQQIFHCGDVGEGVSGLKALLDRLSAKFDNGETFGAVSLTGGIRLQVWS